MTEAKLVWTIDHFYPLSKKDLSIETYKNKTLFVGLIQDLCILMKMFQRVLKLIIEYI